MPLSSPYLKLVSDMAVRQRPRTPEHRTRPVTMAPRRRDALPLSQMVLQNIFGRSALAEAKPTQEPGTAGATRTYRGQMSGQWFERLFPDIGRGIAGQTAKLPSALTFFGLSPTVYGGGLRRPGLWQQLLTGGGNMLMQR